MTVYVSSTTTWSNVEESGINGRYYWKDSSLDNRYCNWYSCDRFNWYFLLWFIFRIGLIPVVIRWIEFSKWTCKKNSTGIHSNSSKKEWIPVEFLIRIISLIRINNSMDHFFLCFKKVHFFLFDVFQKWTSFIDSILFSWKIEISVDPLFILSWKKRKKRRNKGNHLIYFFEVSQ